MLEENFSDPETIARMREGPIGPLIDEYAAHLRTLGFNRNTISCQLRIAAKLSHWLHEREQDMNFFDGRADDDLIEALEVGLITSGPAHLRQVVAYLRDVGLVAPAPPPSIEDTPLRRELVAFGTYLRQEKGLQAITIENYSGFVEQFLRERFPDGPMPCESLRAPDFIQFAVRHAFEHSPKRSSFMVSALRAFLRFLHFRGVIGADLASSIPAAACWRFSSVPDYLEPDELARVLGSCDRTTPKGRRNYAILLMLVRLALRAGEVAKMELEDINWKSGELRVRGKGGKLEVLPLPPDVGEAIADYLRNGRPKNACRKVFLRVRAPIHGMTSAAVSCLAWAVLARADVASRRKGAHVLRHTAATQMLRGGVSLPDIGEALRHARLDTTRIYAKVDFQTLRALAQPWPEDVQ